MKLIFSVTPKGYLPPHFEAYDESKKKHRLATQPITFGEIATPFHGLKLKSQFLTVCILPEYMLYFLPQKKKKCLVLKNCILGRST